MGELLFRKKGIKKYAGIYVYAFWNYRDHPRNKDAEKLEKELIKFMREKGWVKQQ